MIIELTRIYLQSHPAAAALFEYAQTKNDQQEQTAPELEKAIRQYPERIDYNDVFRRLFNNITYTDYLFSLPMGAGKTYLMAAFIYLDLYFAQNEPDNPAFAHNFMIFAPSGLKSSVVPSLRTIQRFDPSWVIPEPAATELKRALIFEVLDEAKSSKKSNKTKNPNVQKIANHQPYSELFGLVAVTNAEKVILDYVEEKDGTIVLEGFEKTDERQANELRRLIGKLPRLSIFIDEVHHAVTDEKKLRAVVNYWTSSGAVNSVLGFSGTPYVESAAKVPVIDKLSISTQEIANIVYYYPLINGIGNFLKRPIVKIAELPDSSRIIEKGVREFLDRYRDTVYPGGLTAKLGIYCGTIPKLEETVQPIVARVVAEYGLPERCILKFYRKSTKKGEKQYTPPADSQLRFDTLDKSISDVRIVLLVQIGKEGWDCRSLTGIILSQEGDCPKNMVLQTSCRCLRQIDKNAPETALIYLNDSNAGKLNDELQKQQHISHKEFSQGTDVKTVTLNRYDRTAYLKLPKVDFYQLRVSYETLITEPANPEASIPNATQGTSDQAGLVRTTDFTMETLSIDTDNEERGTEHASYVKILMDEVFGEEQFKNEVIWHYENKPQFGFMKHLPHDYDSILLYTKSDEHVLNHQLVPVKATQKQAIVSWDPVLKKRVAKRDESGNIIYEERTEKYMGSVWTLPLIHPLAEERKQIDYPTQKPEALLERAIKVASNEGMFIADFFGGSGVTAAVANKLGRRFITCDIGLNAVQTMRDRLAADGAEFDVMEIQDGVSLYRNPVQTMDRIKALIPGLRSEQSINSFWIGAINDSRLGMVPVYVPDLKPGKMEVLDTVMMNYIIHEAIPDLSESVKKVIVYYIDITDETEIRKFIADDDSTDVEIELRDLKTVLDDCVVEDYAEFHVEEITTDLFGGWLTTIDRFASDRVSQKLLEFNNKNMLASTGKSKPFTPIEVSDNGLELIEYVSVDCTAAEGPWHSDSEIKIDKNSFVIRNGKKTKEFWDATLRSEAKPLRLKIRNICGDETEYVVK